MKKERVINIISLILGTLCFVNDVFSMSAVPDDNNPRMSSPAAKRAQAPNENSALMDGIRSSTTTTTITIDASATPKNDENIEERHWRLWNCLNDNLDCPLQILTWGTASVATSLSLAAVLVTNEEAKNYVTWATFGFTTAATLCKGFDELIKNNLLKKNEKLTNRNENLRSSNENLRSKVANMSNRAKEADKLVVKKSMEVEETTEVKSTLNEMHTILKDIQDEAVEDIRGECKMKIKLLMTDYGLNTYQKVADALKGYSKSKKDIKIVRGQIWSFMHDATSENANSTIINALKEYENEHGEIKSKS